jgi:tRNA-dihydrouridine synthase A
MQVSELKRHRRLSVAPMMDWTDRHCRSFLRMISSETLLYTEMVHADAILRGARDRILAFRPEEQPLAVQLGGSDPASLAAAAAICAERGFIEINLNVGCPSDRVQAGRFGACLMADPVLVAECVSAMRAAIVGVAPADDIPQVTVKTRIGIDEQDSLEFLLAFVEQQVDAGIDALIVHARKAWLSGLSPKQNREVPELDYSRVHAVKDAFPELDVIINGGIRDLGEAVAQLERLDGVMIGRAAYNDPWMLADADRQVFGCERDAQSRSGVMERYTAYIERELEQGTQLHHLTRHILGLYQGRPGARAWRRTLTEGSHQAGAGVEVLRRAMEQLEAFAA